MLILVSEYTYEPALPPSYAMKSLYNFTRHLYRCLIPVITLALSAQGQSVTITADKTNGCPPFVVNFSAALDPGYQHIEWDFSLGANVSNDLTPSKSFQNPGVYHVTFTATYAPGNVIVKQMDIRVYNKPAVVVSTLDIAGCAPYMAAFTDKSLPGDGSIADITWDFGDGGGGNGANVTHTFTQAGTYNVISVVKNSMGCSSSGEPVPVKVQNAPVPSFTADKTQSCTAPLTVNLFNSTINNSPDPVTYTYDYGDGSSGEDFKHTYTQEGRYTVTLTAATSGNCSKSLVKTDYIIIEKIKPAFTVANACAGQDVIFKNTTLPAPDQVTWTFPDGSTQTTTDAVKQFSAAGDYTVKMQAAVGVCTEETVQTVHINAIPQIDPVAAPVSACNAPFTTQFNAQSADAGEWAWDFGDGAVSSAENPSHTYTAEGSYNIRLTATNTAGCSVNVNKPGYINIIKPAATIVTDKTEGCIPLPVTFDVTVNVPDPVIAYEWDFGDGGTAVTGNPQHSFNAEGVYIVTVKVTTAAGCTATATTTVQAGALPVVAFDATPLKSCAKDPIQFTNHSAPPESAWLWEFPQDQSTSTDKDPNHTFNVIGNHDVTLIVNNKGCINQLTRFNYIQIIPPIASFSTAPDCVNPYHRHFTDNSTFGPVPTPKSWFWEFGEGGATSTDQHPDFTYTTTGAKQVRLTIDNGTCTSTYTQTIQIIDEKPVISAGNSSICKGKKIDLLVGPMNPANINEYTFDWGNNFSEVIPGENFDPADGKSNTYHETGDFTIVLSITDKNNCVRNSAPLTVTVNGPAPDFDFAGKRCKNEEISFTDLSTANTGNEITQWHWDFGDNATADFTAAPANVTHAYANAEDYTVQLTVTDKFGCTETQSKVLGFEKVKADFMLPTSFACIDKPFAFVDQSAGTVQTYEWDFGDHTAGAGVQPDKTYTAPGKYDVTLKITTTAGCTDQVTKTAAVTVPDPKASFTIPDNLDLCPPVKVLFTNTSTDYVNAAWDFGDNGASTKNDPDAHIYTRAKTYDVVLTVYSDGGCSSSATLPVTIKGPDGSMKTTPTQGCVPLDISISATAVKTNNYMWDFDDGTVITTATPVSPGHTYTKPGIYYPRVSLQDDQGCIVKAEGNDKIIVDKTTADFISGDVNACGGGPVTFTNNSKTLTKDSLALDFSSAWDFGMPGSPGNNASSANGTFNYPQPGTVSVKLVVTSAYGCKDEKTLPVVIPPQPVAEIAPIAPLCVSGKVQLSGSDTKNLPGTQWLWKVGTDRTFSQQVPPEITLNSPGAIPVTLTITNGDGSCPSAAATDIVVNPAPVLNPSPQAAEICRGAALQLEANTTAGVSVIWTGYNISDPGSLLPQVTPDIDTVYKVIATNGYGCTDTGQVAVTVIQPFHVYAQDVEVCAGESVQMNAGGALRYQWIPAAGLNRGDVPDPIATPDGNITYQVVGYNNSACFTDTALARVYVRAAPQVDAGPDMVVATGSVIPLPVKGSEDIVKIEWTPVTGLSCFDCLTPNATPADNITYHVKVTNQFGCTSTDDLAIKLVCDEGNVFIPNTFSPNGDGQNDVFYVRGRGMQTIRVFRIFNRWGQLIFERSGVSSNDISAGWDGRFKGVPLNPDVFVYYVEIVCDKGAVNLLKGNITLIR